MDLLDFVFCILLGIVVLLISGLIIFTIGSMGFLSFLIGISILTAFLLLSFGIGYFVIKLLLYLRFV